MSEKDLDLKLRLMRFLWYKGYFIRRNINLLRFSYGGKTNQAYTDIDVLGLKIDDGFNPTWIVCDCKSGQKAKNTDRIFRLSGVMKYLHAESGIFLRKEVMESRYVELARKLEITPLSLNQLSELEKIYNIDSRPYVGVFNKDTVDKDVHIFNKLKKDNPPVYYYLDFKYWVDPVQQRIKSLIHSGTKIEKSDNIKEDDKMFLKTYLLTLLANSILEFSSYVLILPKEEKEYHIRENLMGGRIESAERKQLFEAFYDFLSKEVSIRSGKEYPVNRNEFKSHFYPKYLKYLVDLVERVCYKPLAAVYVPRLLDVLTYEVILDNKSKDIINEVFSYDQNFSLIETSKLVKDFFTFGQRTDILSEEENQYLKDIINKLELE
ncbi:MAG: hypothetical protein R6U44_00615 [Archaeoglobaceae archaeon]